MFRVQKHTHLRVALKKLSAKTVTRTYYENTTVFGHRVARPYILPDYTPEQLKNRAENAPLLRFVDSVRMHGHRAASIDPLDLMEREEVAALDPTRYGLTDRDKLYDINGIVWLNSVEERTAGKVETLLSLSEIDQHLRSVYVGRIAFEYMHSPIKNERLWWSHLLESAKEPQLLSHDEKSRIWNLMMHSEVFDRFLQAKFPNLKRYGLEGAESMLPTLDSLFQAASRAGVENIVLCMPHRGRLSLLTDLLQYPPTALFYKIRGNSEIPQGIDATGDVISHIAASPTLSYDGKDIHVSLLHNPSHLEAVNPIALGKTRAKQLSLVKDADPDCKLGDKVICIQLHGDAAFTGQGVLMEGFGMSNLPHYTSGGSVHVVVNIGYTTPASSARSSLYCSDIGKMINAPVLHVNGDHPEDVVRAVQIAFSYRNFFRKDVIIDLITYRRWGHNELDEPSFTQPKMYHKIRSRKSVTQLYEDRLISEGALSEQDAASGRAMYRKHLDDQLKATDTFSPTVEKPSTRWASYTWPGSKEGLSGKNPETGVQLETLRSVGLASVQVPPGFEIHPRLQRHVQSRINSLETGAQIDWGTAEAMAWGSLLLDGYDVRISGQDVGRGTFSHRHAMLVNQRTEEVFVPLNVLSPDHKLELANSSLSEMAILGFEYGMSWENPDLLTIWEAQFGDFLNGSQVIIDTFVSSAQTKWLRQSGLVILLPHGLDGAGPEHSSARIERMLQLTNDPYEYHEGIRDVNLHVTNPTTPAQYFHLLRRQMLRNHRKPLVVASPKGLLRSPVSASSIDEFGPGSKFKPVLVRPAPGQLQKIILLSGKVYYDVMKEIEQRGSQGIAVVRLEEISPFPFSSLKESLESVVRHADPLPEILWVQEEARNQGAYSYVAPRLTSLWDALNWKDINLCYVGRLESEVPAVGAAVLHERDKRQFLDLVTTK
ncbi:dehydrogenase E1 and transketolase domain-containing protein 1 [Cantharellus anzutake]|uniref:dehydrogenase E1 and transketolase domain-containing protein 1 n=1 Tax=Cantharellus anzutake TaxID=1750568 RepID=UPI001908AF3C|nr:dehydrogenase E1 and transketolase domain-containing protein 1 [Cantharellus anzutake]KAF8331280.1 dehydrogenase E1 and transketolase domain-containing protein 1 [Cantharellus anzutake]